MKCRARRFWIEVQPLHLHWERWCIFLNICVDLTSLLFSGAFWCQNSSSSSRWYTRVYPDAGAALKAKSAISSIANVEPPSTEPSTAKFFKILEYTQLTVRQISSGSSQNWSIGTDFTHVPRVCRQWLHSSWARLSWVALDSILHDIYSALQIPTWTRAWSLVLCINIRRVACLDFWK